MRVALSIFLLLLLGSCSPETRSVASKAEAPPSVQISARSGWVRVNASAMRSDPAFDPSRWRCGDFQKATSAIRSGALDKKLIRPTRDIARRDKSTGDTFNTQSYQDVLQEFGDRSVCAFVSQTYLNEYAASMAYLAELDAFQGPKVFDGNVSFGVWSIADAAQSYSALRPYFPEEYRADLPSIDAWLGRRIDGLTRTTNRPCPKTPGSRTDDRCNNVDLRIQYAMTAFGAATANSTYLSKGAAALQKHLATMRADGSLPEDSKRGCRALLYSMDSYGFMIGIADILGEHGYDAYAATPEGASIRKGIAFAVAVVDDNSLIMQYSRGRASPNHNDGCRGGRPFRASLDWFEWAYPYLLEFPGDPLSRRIRPVVDGDGKRGSTLFAVPTYLYARY